MENQFRRPRRQLRRVCLHLASTGRRDRLTKRDLYARFDVPEYWLVYPQERTVTIFSEPQDGHYQTETTKNDVAVSATIPGLTVDLAALFAPIRGA